MYVYTDHHRHCRTTIKRSIELLKMPKGVPCGVVSWFVLLHSRRLYCFNGCNCRFVLFLACWQASGVVWAVILLDSTLFFCFVHAVPLQRMRGKQTLQQLHTLRHTCIYGKVQTRYTSFTLRVREKHPRACHATRQRHAASASSITATANGNIVCYHPPF